MEEATNILFWQIMWGSIVFIAVFAIGIGGWLDYRKNMLTFRAQLKEMEHGLVQRELDNVKARLAVLEKIVTDKQYNLKEELDNLHHGDGKIG